MAIPNTQILMFPLLELMEDQEEYKIRQLVSGLADHFDLTEDERRELTPGGSKALFHSRVMSARSYLYRAAVIDHPRRGRSKITKRGLDLLNDPPEKLDLNYLTRYPEFLDYLENNSSAQRDPELRNLLRRVKERLGKKGDEQEEKSSATSSTADHFSDDPKTIKMPRKNWPEAADNPSSPNVQGDDSLLKAVAALGMLNQQNRREERQNRRINADASRSVTGFTQLQIAWMTVVRYLENYFQHPVLFLLPLLLMIAAGVVATSLAKTNYESKGIMFVQEDTLIGSVSSVQDDGFGWVTPAQSTSDELNELLQTDSFVRIIIQQTNLEEKMNQGETVVNETFQEVRRAFSIYPLGQNQFEINVTYEDREIAYQLANAAVNSFIDWQISADKQDTSAARTFLETLVPEYKNNYDAAVSQLETYLLQHPAPVRGERPAIEELQIERLRSDVAIADTRYQGALESLEQIRLEEVVVEGKTRQTYSIIDAPARPRNPEFQDVLIDTSVNIGIFTAVGLALMLVGIAGSTLLDRSLNYPIDVRYATSLPVLAEVPKPKPRRRKFSELFLRRKKRSPRPAAATNPEVKKQPAAASSSATTANQ